MFTKGETIKLDKEKGEPEPLPHQQMLNPGGLEVEELDLGDDLMALQPNLMKRKKMLMMVIDLMKNLN